MRIPLECYAEITENNNTIDWIIYLDTSRGRIKLNGGIDLGFCIAEYIYAIEGRNNGNEEV